MPTRNISQDPNDYTATCTPDRFEEETVIFRCAVKVGKDSGSNPDAKEYFGLEVALNVEDSDSFGEMRRAALKLYQKALANAAKVIADEIGTGH